MADPSPLVRASVAEALGQRLDQANVAALLKAAGDDYRLVRVRAAAALAGIPEDSLPEDQRRRVRARDGRVDGLDASRGPTTWRRTTTSATSTWRAARCPKPSTEFETATRLQPDALPPYVNAALAYNALGQNDKAEASLRHALRLDPTNAAANLNLGMLLAEMGKMSEAEQAFRAAFKADPQIRPGRLQPRRVAVERPTRGSAHLVPPGRRTPPGQPAVWLHLRLLPLSRGPARRGAEGDSPVRQRHPAHEDSVKLRAPTAARAGAQAQRGQAVMIGSSLFSVE